jgi:hypothetical protein
LAVEGVEPRDGVRVPVWPPPTALGVGVREGERLSVAGGGVALWEAETGLEVLARGIMATWLRLLEERGMLGYWRSAIGERLGASRALVRDARLASLMVAISFCTSWPSEQQDSIEVTESARLSEPWYCFPGLVGVCWTCDCAVF